MARAWPWDIPAIGALPAAFAVGLPAAFAVVLVAKVVGAGLA